MAQAPKDVQSVAAQVAALNLLVSALMVTHTDKQALLAWLERAAERFETFQLNQAFAGDEAIETARLLVQGHIDGLRKQVL